jgi:hypothetical protein
MACRRNLKIDRVVGRCVHLDTSAAASTGAATVVIDSRDSLLAPDSSNQRDDEIGHVALGVEGDVLVGSSTLPLNPSPSSMTFTGVHPVRIGAYDRHSLRRLLDRRPGHRTRTVCIHPECRRERELHCRRRRGRRDPRHRQWSDLVNVTVNLVAGDIIDISNLASVTMTGH